MTGTRTLDPYPPEFKRFLYAPVGEDRNGCAVTLLSTLARLGLDPWSETTELVTLGRDAARVRLEDLLSQSKDVPALMTDYGKVARELSLLLPELPPIRSLPQGIVKTVVDRLGSSGAMWAMLGVVFVLAQFLYTLVTGPGE